MKKNYQSEQLQVCHETAKALYTIGAIDSAKMREFDEACLAAEPAFQPAGISRAVTPAVAKNA